MGRRRLLRGTLHRRAQAASFYPAHWAGSIGEDVFVVGHGVHIVKRLAALPVAASRAVKLGGTVATVGFPNIGLQGFAPKLAP
jgi:hypothetical protein